jgi:hypothetical protein
MGRRSWRRDCSPPPAPCWTLSRTAWPTVYLGSQGTELAPAEAADEGDLIDHDAAREKSEKRRSQAYATGWEPDPFSAASSFADCRRRIDRYFAQAGIGRISSFFRRARNANAP